MQALCAVAATPRINFALHEDQTCASTVPQAKAVAEAALAFLAGFNRRTLDMIASRIYFYFSLAHGRLDSLASIRRCAVGQCDASAPQCFARRARRISPLSAVGKHLGAGKSGTECSMLIRNTVHSIYVTWSCVAFTSNVAGHDRGVSMMSITRAASCWACTGRRCCGTTRSGRRCCSTCCCATTCTTTCTSRCDIDPRPSPLLSTGMCRCQCTMLSCHSVQHGLEAVSLISLCNAFDCISASACKPRSEQACAGMRP